MKYETLAVTSFGGRRVRLELVYNSTGRFYKVTYFDEELVNRNTNFQEALDTFNYWSQHSANRSGFLDWS